MTDVAEGSLRFPGLRLVMCLILTILHSNAEEERVFSIFRKNKTCSWPNLDPEETLASNVSIKLATEAEEVECFKILDEILRDT